MIFYSGEWIIFSGNQIGVMLASAVLENYKAQGKPISMINYYLFILCIYFILFFSVY